MERDRPVRIANPLFWPLSDDGVSARDDSGAGFHGTVTGAVQVAGALIGYGGG